MAIANWDEFVDAVAQMRRYQAMYESAPNSLTKDMKDKCEREVDVCVTGRLEMRKRRAQQAAAADTGQRERQLENGRRVLNAVLGQKT